LLTGAPASPSFRRVVGGLSFGIQVRDPRRTRRNHHITAACPCNPTGSALPLALSYSSSECQNSLSAPQPALSFPARARVAASVTRGQKFLASAPDSDPTRTSTPCPWFSAPNVGRVFMRPFPSTTSLARATRSAILHHNETSPPSESSL
jgi:hypothetical protein